MYKDWLQLYAKWMISGLNGGEFETWQHLSKELNKICPECQEGYLCQSCHNTGLLLSEEETAIYKMIEKTIALNVHYV